jgi:hypothetical protein
LTLLVLILVGDLAVGRGLIELVQLLTPALGYDFALIAVSISLPPIGLVGMLIEDSIRSL